jgi:prepilin-type N-terminal cleavage/methylation domain-containing protein
VLRRERLRPADERGVSLVELAVVILIIAVLLGVAVPLLTGSPERGKNRRAQAELRDTMTAAQTIAADQDGYFRDKDGDEIDAADLDGEDQGVAHTDALPTDPGPIYVNVEDDEASLTLVRLSDSGRWFCISASRDGDTRYDSDPDDGAAIDSRNQCDATTDGTEW